MSKSKAGFIAGLATLVAFAGVAWAQVQSTREVKARYVKGYTTAPTDYAYTKDYVFFREGDGIAASSKVYKDNREDVTDFVIDEAGAERDGVEKAYTGFTKRFNFTKEEFTYANFVTRVWTPNRFIVFADYVEKIADENKSDFGITVTASREDINRFFFNYFSGKENSWNPDAAYAAFKKTFGIIDESISYAFFRDYYYIPGLLRTVGNKTIIGIKNANVTATEMVR